MVHARNKKTAQFACMASFLLLLSGQVFAQQDPPSRVARLNYVNGNVSMEPAGVDEWAPAEVNRPFTIGDYLYADQGAQAELHLDVGVIRIGSQTSFGFLNLDDRTVQLKLTEGDMEIRVHDFGSDQVFEVDTPNAAVTLLRDGIYRFRVDANGNMSFVVVREGQAQITGGGQAFTLNPDNAASLSGTDQLAYQIELAPQPDEFDQWCQQRDAHEAQLASRGYLPPTVIGGEDLGDYGVWQEAGQYGTVWYPQNVDPGWAPYHSGHWAWIDPWGWTWVDSMPWGFAPFHYGRWAYIGNRWGWCPGPIVVGYPGPVIRPYYAPAMVAWFGGANWGVGVSMGSGPSLGWVPLGWGEVYTPAYRCSPRYFDNVNVYNTRIVNTVNITNVYNNVYVNKQVYNQQFVNVRAPNAVMTMPQAAFASGQSVRQAAVAVKQADFARLQTASVVAPPVAPTRQSFAPTAGRPVPRPAAQVIQRQVVAKNTPPPAPAPFAQRQQYLQQHAGQLVDPQAMRQAVPSVRPVVANVRKAPPANAVAVKPGQRVGSAAVFDRPAVPVSQQAPAQQNGRTVEPAVQSRPGQQPSVSRPAQPANEPHRKQQPPPNAHGVPPNLRQGNSQPAENGRFAERTPPSNAQPPRNVPPTEPQVGERSQPAPERAQPPVRQQPQTEERTQPAPERAQPPARQQPQTEERTQPAPERAQPPARQQPQTEERTQPAPERAQPPARQQPPTEERTQPAPERRAYPERSTPPEERSQPKGQESKPTPHDNSHPSQGDHSKSDKKSS